LTAKPLARPFKRLETAPTGRTSWRVAIWDISFPLRRYFLVRGKPGDTPNRPTRRSYIGGPVATEPKVRFRASGGRLFFMNAGALKYLDDSKGFEIGVGPSVVVVDQGLAKKFSSTTLTQDVYAIIFGQKGFMAGIGLEGSKITKIR
jgi:hypothetical protein